MPALPEAASNVATYPRLGLENVRSFLGRLEVSPPASDVGAPAVTQLFTAQTLTASPHLPHFVFEPLHPLWCRTDLAVPVDQEPEELAFPKLPHPALGCVDFQAQLFLFDEIR